LVRFGTTTEQVIELELDGEVARGVLRSAVQDLQANQQWTHFDELAAYLTHKVPGFGAARVSALLYSDGLCSIKPGSGQRCLDLAGLGMRVPFRDFNLYMVRITTTPRTEERLAVAADEAERMHVIDDERARSPIARAPPIHRATLERLDELIDELRAAHACHRTRKRRLFPQPISDGVHEVRLADAGTAVNEQRIVARAGRFHGRFRCAQRELVRLADDERLERVRRPRRRRRVMRGDRLLDAGLRFRNALRIAKDVEASEPRIEQDGLRLELLQTSDSTGKRRIERIDVGFLVHRERAIEHRGAIARDLPMGDALTEPHAPAFHVLRDSHRDVGYEAREFVARGRR